MNFDDEVKRLEFYLKDCEEENKRLREKFERYEKALKDIAESDEDSSCNELALKYEVIADTALNC